MRTTAAASLIAALCLAAPAGAGGPERIPVDISIRLDTSPRSAAERGTFEYQGKLSSRKRACETGRIVTLWKINEGTDVKQSVGTDESSGTGKWAVLSLANTDGEYFATTPKITLGSGKICKRGRSESLIRDVQP